MEIKLLLSSTVLLFGLMFVDDNVAGVLTASMLANTCTGCHGTNGSSMGPASPTIAGMSRDYFVESMLAYKNEKRPSTIMSRIAKGYSEEEVGLMADYFSQQLFMRRDQVTDGIKVSFGKKLHKKYCEKCHEQNGGAASDDAGILAGQWLEYLQYTMDDYVSGRRSMEKKMKKNMERLQQEHGANGIEALIHFYASQR